MAKGDGDTVVPNTRSLKATWSTLWLLLLPMGAMMGADAARTEKTLKTTPTPRISLNNLTGQVVIKGWSRTQVHSVCTTSSPAVEVDISALPTDSGPAEKIHFDTHVLDPLATGKGQSADYEMEVPFGSSLEVTNRQGGVVIENLQGEASVECVGSTISVRDVAGHLAVRSVGGDIEVLRPSGRVEASSITGNLHFVSATGAKLRGITTSGKVLYEGDLASGGDYELSSYSGDIDIICPPSASFELSAKTLRGKVDNGLALIPKRHSPSAAFPGESLLGLHNTGNATVLLQSFSGSIRIRPQP
jgi:DUF4097 and DUF4098 domain-containing protein YvlB